jgi:hypothetical protein
MVEIMTAYARSIASKNCCSAVAVIFSTDAPTTICRYALSIRTSSGSWPKSAKICGTYGSAGSSRTA